ncbi:MAG: acetyl-CoA carboxylase biotin carboxylase subunit [Butyribacter sp.]|jgi:acetyl-CoA carboxylase biotin carboxylase subunit|uniref:Biotin carboxylase n=1 Tax=Butyribacter intestini TaxID=1703332 RepID=A0AAW3JPX4_9FIRM|nr:MULTISPECIES: acetyl-CoA carboxylase biotin carboxylase subunit [Clostridia]KQC84280.1 acetyl-CoA carboxylase biotin carboxylase subunit [Butyribacter intestini]MBS5364295.1 acetyl-CoA carboxylase biotin carboxylase subunit [Clostridium sp.]RHP23788.1 acetyl-CoA carboxylase biotin carboxylase subunit [Clostridium sp. AF34-13]RHU72336.1 acetyl-CoA carboxylase biotin carboxylase subunit [Butyribacter intestini]
MFDKILIANRGEIAVRIIRACREMGIKTVAVFSEPDREALHTQLADEAVCIGSAKVGDSYLDMNNIISAAVEKQAQAIHPGFGFLSENSMFAGVCKDCNIKFIGPKGSVIDALGNKANARQMMINAGVPVIPGSDGILADVEQAYEMADKLGYPVIVKASAGGGGKGIRIVRKKEELKEAFLSAQSETKAAFGDDSMYMEKLIEGARHVEVQILGDSFGNVIHLGERDCSLQRKNQKVLEETPCEVLSESTRAKICDSAVRAAKAAGYENAGTIEFLYDEDSDKYYFMEMNTRVQVEHPITEMVTGVDIVKEQIRIAAGEKLLYTQDDIKISGHAIECRINAENPSRNFAPCPGTIDYLLMPSGGLGLRVDSAIYQGYEIPPYYDSMLAKVIVHGRDRDEAIAKMKRALYEFIIEGVDTNIEYQNKILNNKQFEKCQYNTSFLENVKL